MSVMTKVMGNEFHYGTDQKQSESIYVSIEMIDASMADEVKREVEAFISHIKGAYLAPIELKKVKESL